MKLAFFVLCIAVVLTACDDTRVYEKNYDFERQRWMAGHKPEFEFPIVDTAQQYNIYCTVRNTVTYPYSRLFFTYYMQDSIGLVLEKKLINYTMFDPKTGAPEGTSGLGDIYDHRVPLISNHKFSHPGIHKMKFEQFMRKDTLEGIIAVGVRVEKIESDQ
jgi:gliding motility-associated lipoprotein GldH